MNFYLCEVNYKVNHKIIFFKKSFPIEILSSKGVCKIPLHKTLILVFRFHL